MSPQRILGTFVYFGVVMVAIGLRFEGDPAHESIAMCALGFGMMSLLATPIAAPLVLTPPLRDGDPHPLPVARVLR